ncbi:MAG: carboxyl transferase [Ruminococcaceae bacterium]|nr:carboxyl transferase [Oscillospiraceae bacterium]
MSNNSKAYERLTALFDDGIFTEIEPFAKSAEGEIEVAAGYGTVGGQFAYAFSQDSEVCGGAVTVAHCAKIKKVYDLAQKTGKPVIGIYDSNGVKLTEGFEVLSAYGEIVKASARVSGVVPQISIIAGACIGTSALMANLADVVIAVKEADFYVTAPSEVTAQSSAENGVIDILADAFDSAVNSVKSLLPLLPENNLSIPVAYIDGENNAPVSADMDTKELIAAISTQQYAVEFKADYTKSVVTSLAVIGGETAGVIAFDGGAISPKAAYKAEAMLKLCDAFSLPVITFANADGFAKDCEAQMLTAATKLTSAYASATCPKISLITKKAVGGAYITLAGKGANADLTLAWDTAVVSPLDTDSAVAFLWNDRLADGEDRAALEKEFNETIGSAYSAAACGAIDDVFTPDMTTQKLIGAIEMLISKRETTLPRKHSVK